MNKTGNLSFISVTNININEPRIVVNFRSVCNFLEKNIPEMVKVVSEQFGHTLGLFSCTTAARQKHVVNEELDTDFIK